VYLDKIGDDPFIDKPAGVNGRPLKGFAKQNAIGHSMVVRKAANSVEAERKRQERRAKVARRKRGGR